LKIHGDGRKLSNKKISLEVGISPVTVNKYLKEANLKSWDTRKKFSGKRNKTV
jgi:transposase